MKTQPSTRRQLLAVISSMDRRVTIPDMVARTGLPLATVSKALNDLAFELKADLDVTASGQIYYRFPQDLHYRYFSNRVLETGYRIWTVIAPVLSFIFRISFGIVLLMSITVVFLIMLTLQALMCAFSGNTHEILNVIKEFFSLTRRLKLLDTTMFRRDLPENADEGLEENKDRGFLLNCYEVLFGPEDPNKRFEEEKSKAIAQLIRANHGIVLPEQLAPLTGRAADELEGAFPVLAKFHGIPAATPSGHLIYKFPEMQEAQSDCSYKGGGETQEALRMHHLVFANISADSIKPILLLAVANFLGTVFFWTMLFAVRSNDTTGENFFLVLALYASFFLFIPAVRYVAMFFKNRRIKDYNEKIGRLESTLTEPPHELLTALSETERMRREEVAKLTDQLAYTTSRDYLEQETDQLFESPSPSDKPAT